MLVNYKQANDKRWKAGEQVSATATPHGTMVTWAPTKTSSGVCLGLSCWWLILRGKGADFWDWLKPPLSACPQRPFQPPQNLPGYWSQKMMAGLGGATEAIQDVKDVMYAQANDDGLSWGRGYRVSRETIEAKSTLRCETDGLDTIPMSQFTAAVSGLYVIFLIGNSQKSSEVFRHAIAAHVTQGKVVLFDPNIGEADDLDATELPDFCMHLLKVQYGQNFLQIVGFLRFT